MGSCISKARGINGALTITPSTDPAQSQPDQQQAAKTAKRRKSVSSEPGKQLSYNTATPIVPKDAATKARLQHIISTVLLFSELDQSQRERIIDAMFERKVKAGQVVIKQGEEGDNFYVVEEGEYTVSKDGVDKFVYRGIGSFGELALMYNCPRAATVTAESDGILWALDRATFRTLVVASTVERRKQTEKFLRSVKLFKDLSSEQLAAISDCLTPEQFKGGDTIIKQDQELDAKAKFYILEKGTVECYRGSKGVSKLTKTMQPGDVFGEVALITNEPRQADCIASSDVQCLAMSRDAFERLMGPVESSLASQVENYYRLNSRVSMIKVPTSTSPGSRSRSPSPKRTAGNNLPTTATTAYCWYY